MGNIIIFVPVIIGAVLICVGLFIILSRSRRGICIEGIVTGKAQSKKKCAGVEILTEAPIVKYEIDGKVYNLAAAEFYTEGTAIFKKGKKINIRVNRKNHQSFKLCEKNCTAERLLIFCGAFMILADIIMYVRYY